MDNALKFTPARRAGRVHGGGVAAGGHDRGLRHRSGRLQLGAPLPLLAVLPRRGGSGKTPCLERVCGLTMAAAVVEEDAGGRILVSQNQPQGSTFTVCLPHPNPVSPVP